MNINLALIGGRLTAKPELKTLSSGNAVCNFSAATNYRYKDKNGTLVENPTFHRMVAYGRMGENIATYFDKGDEIFIRGRINTRSWQAADGTKRYATEIIVEAFEFGKKAGEGKKSSQQAPAQQYDNGQDPMPNNDEIPI